MPDPITLTLVGSVALTEGIKFLYGQAGEIMKRWRERQDANPADSKATEPTDLQLPNVFEGQLDQPEIHFDEVERREDSLLELRSRLANYADGAKSVTHQDEHLLETVNDLRQVLEAIYQQSITFKGEQRAPSGTTVRTKLKLQGIQGKATGTRVGQLSGGEIDTQVDVEGDIGPEAEFIGTNIDEMKGTGSGD